MYVPQDIYNKFLQYMPIVCVDVCIVKNSKVLLCKRVNEPCKGQWYIPGGGVRKNEKLETTAYRKAHQETDLICEIYDVLHVENAIYNTGINNIPTHNVNICFYAIPVPLDQEIKLNDENSDYKWVTRKEAEKMNLHPYVIHSIRKAFL